MNSKDLMFAELASGGHTSQVPYQHLEKNMSQCVMSEYLPAILAGFIIRDPRNMKKADIQAFFEHVKLREQEHGVECAFRFSSYYKADSVWPACYSHDTNGAQHRRRPRRLRMSGQNTGDHTPTGSASNAGTPAAGDGLASDSQGPEPASNDRREDSPDWPGILNEGLYRSSDNQAGINYTVPIDPSLLSHNGQNEQSPGVDNSGTDNDTEMCQIDAGKMAALREKGFDMVVLPLNGPSEGAPLYMVPRAAITLLQTPQPTTCYDSTDLFLFFSIFTYFLWTTMDAPRPGRGRRMKRQPLCWALGHVGPREAGLR